MDYIKIKATDLTYVLGNIDKIKEDLNELKQKQLDRVYSNKEMLSTLGVSDKLLIQYRNDESYHIEEWMTNTGTLRKTLTTS
ncbi:hypothetical protein [Prevotellamassilia timonensis]|uniref:hypothetical protein n=1 Tax=Prevotellamassilia timonensis TaxID=1852370 RepID=UPI001F334392|nr:hypothetical protein [Prevotellamassilia timonensis]MCF2634946.1 hypothetical protein [Prevotellamassilia timonensis]